VEREPLSAGPTAQQVARALDLPSEELARQLSVSPFSAPTAERHRESGRRETAATVRVGRLVRVGDVVLAPGLVEGAVEALPGLEAFTVGDAARALRTSRRVAVPVLENLDALRITVRDEQGRRTMREG